MNDMGGCGFTLLVLGVCFLISVIGFFFHIGWNFLDYVMG